VDRRRREINRAVCNSYGALRQRFQPRQSRPREGFPNIAQ